MAYNRKNKLFFMQQVIKVYLEHKQPGITTAYVYRTYIAPRYHISISTLYNYLNTPVVRELNRIEAEKNRNTKAVPCTADYEHNNNKQQGG